jgi:hypothetical protein
VGEVAFARRQCSSEQSGDLLGLSRLEAADSESVDELIAEGNAFEADVVVVSRAAGDADEKEVRTHEVPEDAERIAEGLSRIFSGSRQRPSITLIVGLRSVRLERCLSPTPSAEVIRHPAFSAHTHLYPRLLSKHHSIIDCAIRDCSMLNSYRTSETETCGGVSAERGLPFNDAAPFT